MKPNWKDAPEWAKYLAMDGDDMQWWWYADKPDAILNEKCWHTPTGPLQSADDTFDSGWLDTLEERPEE